MSMCLCFQNNDQLIIAADTAVTRRFDGKLYREREQFQKLTQIGNFLIFGCGRAEVYIMILNRFERAEQKTAEKLREIIEQSHIDFSRECPEYKRESVSDKGGGIAIIAASYEEGQTKVYTIGPQTNYDLKTYTVDGESTKPHAGGYFAEESLEYIRPKMTARVPIANIIIDTFNQFSGAEVGGDLVAASISSKGIEFFPRMPINEQVSIPYFKGQSSYLIGSEIRTSESYPRTEMSTTSNMFGAYQTPTRYAALTPLTTTGQSQSPGIEMKHDNTSLCFGYGATALGGMGLYTSGEFDMQAMGGLYINDVRVPDWRSIRGYSIGSDGQTLNEAIDAKADQAYVSSSISALLTRIQALEADKATKDNNTSTSGSHNHGIAEGTVLMKYDGTPVTYHAAPSHSHVQR